MKYRVNLYTQVECYVLVDAKNEYEANEKAVNAIYCEEYVNESVGFESTDYDVEVDYVSAPNSIEISPYITEEVKDD